MTQLQQSFAAAALFACAAVIGCTSKKLETDHIKRVETAAKDAQRAAERARRAAEEARSAAKIAEEGLVTSQDEHAAERKEIERRNAMAARAPMAETQARSSVPPPGIGALKFSPRTDSGRRFASLTVGAYGASGQTTEVQYLRPNERSGHDIAIDLDIEAGVEIEALYSPSHAIEAEEISPTAAGCDSARSTAFRTRTSSCATASPATA